MNLADGHDSAAGFLDVDFSIRLTCHILDFLCQHRVLFGRVFVLDDWA